MMPFSSKASRPGSSPGGSSRLASAVTAKPWIKLAEPGLERGDQVPDRARATVHLQGRAGHEATAGDGVPLQVRDERLADRGQLTQARGSGQGTLHDLFVESGPPRSRWPAEAPVWSPAAHAEPSSLRPRAAARVLAESPSGPSSVASDAAARRIASRLRSYGHASLIALAT